MIDVRAAVRSQLIPIDSDNLILPNTAIAEVIYYQEPEPVSGGPAWLLGVLSWRDRSIPLVCFELASGQPQPAANPQVKIAVLNALGGNPELSFFAIVTQRLPQLSLIDETRIAAIEHEIEKTPLILSRVIINGEPAIIPNLDTLEAMLLDCKRAWLRRKRKGAA